MARGLLSRWAWLHMARLPPWPELIPPLVRQLEFMVITSS